MASPIKIFPDGFGYLSGDSSQVYLTNDHGQTWTVIQTGLERVIHCQFINVDIGFASDLDKLVKTMDGGKTWTMISDHPAIMIYFFNELEGVTLQTVSSDFHYSYEGYEEDCNAFLTTTDGGLTWIEGPPSENFVPQAMQFLDNHTAIVTSNYKPGIVKYFK